jgi:SSS family solute:Na+ symporter
MHVIDYIIFVVYMLAMLGVGLYFFIKIKLRIFYVSGRNMSSWHIGLSVVWGWVLNWFRRTRFYNGDIRSWMLFTGLLVLG